MPPFAYHFRPAAVLGVSGSDAFSFLQGQFSNDLRPNSAEGNVTYGLWLSVKGKVEADSFVIQRAKDRFLVVSPGCTADSVRSRLEAFIVADDVVVEDVTMRWSGIAAWGENAQQSAKVMDVGLPAGKCAVDSNEVIGIESHRWGAGTIEWLIADSKRDLAGVGDKLTAAGFSLLSVADAELERIIRGPACVPAELGATDLPQEAGFESFAVSFNKGCFTGQEVMARLKSMGRVRRGLVRVRGEGACPNVPVSVFAGDRNIGELRSAAPSADGGYIGRAMVSLMNLPERVSVGGAGPGAPVLFVEKA